MRNIPLVEDLSIKKLDPTNPKDVWLISKLDKDPLIIGNLCPLESIFFDCSYLFNNSFYQSPYAIYNKRNPVGFLEVSEIVNHDFVDILYGLLEQERGKGYLTKTLLQVTKQILTDPVEDMKRVLLRIGENNQASKKVAVGAGFVDIGLVEEEHELQKVRIYEKKKII